jgi:hypothetical protein
MRSIQVSTTAITAGIKIDPEFRDLIPPLSPEEFDQLEKSVVARGLLSPLLVWKEEGILVDGHNRHKICTKHGIGFETVEMEFADRTSAMLWIIDNQFGRRNLPIITRVQLMERRKHLIKSRQGERTDLPPENDQTLRENSREVDRPSDQLAEMAGVSPKTYRAAKLILDAEEGKATHHMGCVRPYRGGGT